MTTLIVYFLIWAVYRAAAMTIEFIVDVISRLFR